VAKENQADAFISIATGSVWARNSAALEKSRAPALESSSRAQGHRLARADETPDPAADALKVFHPSESWLKRQTGAAQRISKISTPPRIEAKPLPPLRTWNLSRAATIHRAR